MSFFLIITLILLQNTTASSGGPVSHSNITNILGSYNTLRASLNLPLYPNTIERNLAPPSSRFIPTSIITNVTNAPGTAKFELKRRRRRAIDNVTSRRDLTFSPGSFGQPPLKLPVIIHAYKLMARAPVPDLSAAAMRVRSTTSRTPRVRNQSARSKRVGQGRGKANRMS